MAKSLYPLLLTPVSRANEPSAQLLGDFLETDEPLDPTDASEVWQAVDCGDLQTVVANGEFAGQSLRQLVQARPEELVGRRHAPESPFPLATRILDVGADQPWQVHPDKYLKVDSETFPPNAKFWFSLAARRNSNIVAGIAPGVTGQQLLSQLNKPGLTRLLRTMPAREGDAYLIPPGMLHSAGAGNLLYEVSLAPYQPLRLGGTGIDAELLPHEQNGGLEALHLEARQNPRISREASPMTHTRRINLTRNCPFFQVSDIRLFDPISMRTDGDSFHLLTTIRGRVRLTAAGVDLQLKRGTTCCVPAGNGDYQIRAETEDAELLRITRPYVP